MTLEVKLAGKELLPEHMRVLITGQPGSGKTGLAATAPNPIFANCRGHLEVLAGTSTPYVDIETEEDLLRLKNTLGQGAEDRRQNFGVPIDTLVLDTFDAFQRLLLNERLKAQGRTETTLNDYGWLGQRLHFIMEGLCELDMNLVVLCHLKDQQDGEVGKITYKPNIAGSFVDQIHEYFHASLVLRSCYVDAVTDTLYSVGGESEELEVSPSKRFWSLRGAATSAYEWLHDKTDTVDHLTVTSPEYLSLTTIFKDMDSTLIIPEPTQFQIPEPGEVSESVAFGFEPNTLRIDKEEIPAPVETPAEVPVAPVAPVQEPVQTTDIPCTDCTKLVENPDRVEISNYRFGTPLCMACFSQRRSS